MRLYKIDKNIILFSLVVLIVALEFLFFKQIIAFDEPYKHWDHINYLKIAESGWKGVIDVSNSSFVKGLSSFRTAVS